MQNLEKLYTKEFFTITAMRSQIRPFPGRWPTRWGITIEELIDMKWKGIFKYQGKPNPVLIKKIERMCAVPGRKILFLEYDKGGAFVGGYRPTPTAGFAFNWVNQVIHFTYYPWSLRGHMFECWKNPMYSKNIRFGRHSFYVYSPHVRMNEELQIQSLREYRTWLKRPGLLK